MSWQDICDCCERRPGTYDIEEKVRARKWWGGYGETFSKTLTLCSDCWVTIGALTRKDPRAELKRLMRKGEQHHE